MRWGLVGYGDLAAKRVAAALREAPGSELVAVWGRRIEKSEQFAAAHGISRAHGSLETLVDSDLDAVYVCTPPDSHTEYALAALSRGKHVLVEKPMAVSVADCERMVAAASRAKVKLGVAYYRRAFPKMQRVKALIDAGVLGTPIWAHMAYHSWFNPPTGDPKHWRVEKGRSGGAGALADIGVHRLDLLDYWLGESRVACADLRNLVHSYEVEDGAAVLLTLSNGAPVTALFAWNSKTYLDRFEIVGSEGKAIIDPVDSSAFTVIRGRDVEHLKIDPPANVHLPCVADFVEAVQQNREPLCSGAAGLRTNRLLADILGAARK